MIENLFFSTIFIALFGLPIMTAVYTMFIRKAPVMESNELVKKYFHLQKLKGLRK